MKKVLLTILTIMVSATFMGCSNVDIDANILAESLINNCEFGEILSPVSSAVAQKRYMLDDSEVEECVSYAGTPAVVDEVTIIKSSDVNSVNEKVSSYFDSKKASYTDYAPNEVPKIENRVVITEGDYVVICVSENSETAQYIIDEYLN